MHTDKALRIFRSTRICRCEIHLAILISVWLTASSAAVAQEGGWAVAGRAGTLGFGAEVHRLLVPRVLVFRGGAQFFRYSADLTDSGINYGARLKLETIPIGLDVYPFRNWFRLTGGMIVNLNEVTGTAIPAAGTITINHVTYSAAQIGQLDAAVKFNRAAPFFGLGFGRSFKPGKHWGMRLDLGAMYHGQPRLALSTTQPAFLQLQNDLRQQEQRFNNDAKDYTFYPIIQFGVSYRFGKTR